MRGLQTSQETTHSEVDQTRVMPDGSLCGGSANRAWARSLTPGIPWPP
jgi:hypothetical protein